MQAALVLVRTMPSLLLALRGCGMIQRLAWAFLVVAMLTGAAGCTNPRTDWRTLRPQTGHFTVEIPKDPQHTTRNVQTTVGNAYEQQYCAHLTETRPSPSMLEPIARRIRPQPMSLCVVQLQWPTLLGTTSQENAAAIDETLAAYVQTFDPPHMVTEEQTEEPNGRGWLIEGRIADQRVFARIRLYPSERTLFALTVTGRSRSELDSAVSKRFLHSFRIS